MAVSSDRGAAAIRGGAIRVIGYVAGILVSLGSATILVRHLGVATFGRYVTVTSLVALVGSVTEAGIYLFGIREFGARADGDRRQLLANLLGMRLTLTLAGIVCAVGFALAVGYRHVVVLGVVVAGAGLLVQVVADVLSIPLQSHLRLGRLTVVDLTRRVAALALIGTLALLGAGVVPLLAVSIASGLVALGLLAWMVRAWVAIRVSFDRQAWRQLFADTLPFAVAVSIGGIYIYVTVIVMSLIASATQTGLFATSFRVNQVALGVPVLLLTAIFPLMSRDQADQQAAPGDMVGKVFAVALITGVWMSLSLVFGASFIIRVIAGSQGRGAVSVLRIQGAVLTLAFVSTASALGLMALRRYRTMIISSSSAILLDVLLALVLVPHLGARGGALADVITEGLVAVGLTMTLMRAVPSHEIKASMAPPVLLAGALSASVLLVPIGAVARVILGTVIYFGVLILTHALPDELTRAVRKARLSRAPL